MAPSSGDPSGAVRSEVPKLSLRGVRKEFGGVVAVEDMWLDVWQGEFVSLLGPSGCGKSTTLAMIAGLEAPTRGTIAIDGVTVNDVAPQLRKVGLVFQDYAIFTKMSVHENLAFGLRARGASRGGSRKKVWQIAEFLELVDVLQTRADRLTMSELQRVALGRVLVLEPSLLLLDEPLSNLDAAFRGRLRSELRSLQRRLGQTVVYVTHDHVEAMAMSDRVAVMHQGRLLQVGTVSEVFDHPKSRFVAEFLGEPPMNLVPCQLRSEEGQTVVAVGPLRVRLNAALPPARAGRWLLGVRPHDVQVHATPQDGFAPAVVDLIEPVGPETILHLRLGEHMIQAVVPPSVSAKPSQTWWLSVSPAQVHLIDEETGEVGR